MNFFAHQARARTNTTRLVLLFFIAIISLIAITELFVVMMFPLLFSKGRASQLDQDSLLYISLFIVSVVVIAWLYKTLQLAKGGRAIAEAFGAQRISAGSDDPHERMALNVVEEMAIASGIAVPPVYILEEHGINAFVAGYSHRDAIVALTRGSIQLLSRDELQGVVAHEFSHIFNGDMRLNIRLISALHGILVIGMLGEVLLEHAPRRRGYYQRCDKDTDNNFARGGHGSPGLYLLGIGLYIIGYLGYFFGSLIKAAVSRQREFLADASAVQYTRLPGGIGNALRKIGGYPLGAYVQHNQAHETSHLFFCNAIRQHWYQGLATHPPLKERIRRIDPAGGSSFIKVTLPDEIKINPHLLKSSRKGIAIDPDAYPSSEAPRQLDPIEFLVGLAASATPASALDYAGAPTLGHVEQAREIINHIPPQLKSAAHDNYDVQALMYCLLLDKHRPAIHEQQLAYLQSKLPADIVREVLRIKDAVSLLAPRHRLPLLEMAVTTLRQLSTQQYQTFKQHLLVLIRTDKTVDLMEWSLYRFIVHHLEDKARPRLGQHGLPHLQDECQRLLSAIALASSEDPDHALRSFKQGWDLLGLPARGLIHDALTDIAALDRALKRCNQLHPLKKPLLIKACCASLHNEEDAEGIELVRTLVDGLDVPMPPLLAQQKLS